MNPEDVVPVEEAIRRYPKLASLRALADRGWKFFTREAGDGQLLQLDGFYCWPHEVTDAIAIYAETNAKGLRTLGDQNDIVWKRIGTVAEVIDGLLELPAPGLPNAPRLVKGSASKLWTPRSSW